MNLCNVRLCSIYQNAKPSSFCLLVVCLCVLCLFVFLFCLFFVVVIVDVN